MLWTVLFLIALTLLRFSLTVAEKLSESPKPGLSAAGEILESLTVAVVVVYLVIKPFVVQAFYIPSESMRPTLVENDRILVSKLSYRFRSPERGEVVVFKAPRLALQRESDGDEEFIKRVVGLPGDVVEVRERQVIVNGEQISEPYAKEPPCYEFPATRVPEGRLFVMGDNRNHSNDSHRWGTLPTSQLVGRATHIFWPPSRVGAVR